MDKLSKCNARNIFDLNAEHSTKTFNREVGSIHWIYSISEISINCRLTSVVYFQQTAQFGATQLESWRIGRSQGNT